MSVHRVTDDLHCGSEEGQPKGERILVLDKFHPQANQV